MKELLYPLHPDEYENFNCEYAILEYGLSHQNSC